MDWRHAGEAAGAISSRPRRDGNDRFHCRSDYSLFFAAMDFSESAQVVPWFSLLGSILCAERVADASPFYSPSASFESWVNCKEATGRNLPAVERSGRCALERGWMG